MDSTGSLGRQTVIDHEKLLHTYDAIREDYDALRKRHADLSALHSQTVNNLELSQEEVSRGKKLLEEAVRERNGLKQQCTAAIRQWDSALRELNEYKEALQKVQQQHDEAIKEINQAMAVRIKTNKDIKRLTEERDAALQEYSLIMSERDSVHRELEKLTDDLAQSKKQVKSLEVQNKELSDKVSEAVQEADVSKRRRDWAFSERDKIVRERESLRTLCDRLRRERDRAVSDLAEALSESEDIKKQKNLASKQLKELRERFEYEKESRSIMRAVQLSNSSSFSESRDSAIDSDLPSGHYSIKLPNTGGTDHGLVLEPGVYISRIVPGSPAAKDVNLNIGDRVLYINDIPIDNVQDAILALSEDIDPIILTLSRSMGHLASPMNSSKPGSLAMHLGKSGTQGQQGSVSHNSTSSLKSDKSETSGHRSNVGNQSHTSSRNRSKKTRLTNLFGVKLTNRKKLSSPEEAILATLDSAIDSGAGTNGAQRKIRKKRSGRSGNTSTLDPFDSSNRGTWPRVLAHRSNNSYTLPHHATNGEPQNDVNDSTSHSEALSRDIGPSQPPNMHRNIDSGIYNPYGTTNSRQSNTVCVRKKERTPISSLTWDNFGAHSAKSVGAISQIPLSNKSPNLRYSDIASLKTSGLGVSPPSVLQSPYHRYSMGIFDTATSTAGKLGKGMPERKSVVPTLTMSDGSSIDFSVKSGNMEILDYYVKRMAKNQNNSSESDHLDKVVASPYSVPSLALTSAPIGSAGSTGRNHNPSQYSVGGSTIDKFANHFATIASPNPRYSHPLHHHDIGAMQLRVATANAVSIPLSMPMANPSTSYSFEPSFQHTHSHGGTSGAGSSNIESSISANSTLVTDRGKINNFLRNSDDLLLQPTYSVAIDSAGTFPRNKEPQRIRIPSNQSVTSRSSAEKFEPHGPMPTYHVESARRKKKKRVLDPGSGPRGGDYGTWPRKPATGELRKVRIEKYGKSTELGFNISRNTEGGVFVCSVIPNSLASQVGLQIGDQVLEVCGINMRSATFELAASVLRQCGDSISMLVQYAPDKFHEEGFDDDNSSSGRESNPQSDDDSSSGHDDENNSSMSENESHSSARSGSPTPCNSPQSTLGRNAKKGVVLNSNSFASPNTSGSAQATSQIINKLGNLTLSGNASLKKNQISQGLTGNPENQKFQKEQQQQLLQQQQSALVYSHGVSGVVESKSHDHQSTLRSSVRENSPPETRLITLSLMKNSANLGICLVGGNLVGIFVHSVQQDSIAQKAGLRTGDQLLEYNSTSLRHATAEEAAFELAKPLEKVNVLVQYNIQRYEEIKDQPGDGFYIRALFDHPALSADQHSVTNPESQDLSFHKDEILYVDNTMYNGKPGRWRAWKVDSAGHRRVWGVIPSKYKVEEDQMFKRSLADIDGDRRTSTITRRSFFRRKSQHRSSSRELASFSDFSVNSYGDLSQNGGLQLKDDSSSLALTSYQRVERLEYMIFLRPVLIIGTQSDIIIDRLIQDYPNQFARNAAELMYCSGPQLEKGLADNTFVDYKRRGSHYECVTMQSIKELSAKKIHCILDISTAGVDRLQRAQFYPVVLMIKFKTPKLIREFRELQKGDKITTKAAKELYEHAQKVESEYKHVITATILVTNTNMSYLPQQVKQEVEKEQATTLWVPV